MCGNTALTEGQRPAEYRDPGWITQIVSAAVGSAEDLTAAISHPNGTVSATAKHYGLGLLEAVNASHLHWRWDTSLIDEHQPKADSGDDDGEPSSFSDELWLVKTRHGPQAARRCEPRAHRGASGGARRHDYETCLVGEDGRVLGATCSAEQTEKTLGEH